MKESTRISFNYIKILTESILVNCSEGVEYLTRTELAELVMTDAKKIIKIIERSKHD